LKGDSSASNTGPRRKRLSQNYSLSSRTDAGRYSQNYVQVHPNFLYPNERGLEGTSLADLMEATGLEKGGIYRHFPSKEAVALEAFEYACLPREYMISIRFRTACSGAPLRVQQKLIRHANISTTMNVYGGRLMDYFGLESKILIPRNLMIRRARRG